MVPLGRPGSSPVPCRTSRPGCPRAMPTPPAAPGTRRTATGGGRPRPTAPDPRRPTALGHAGGRRHVVGAQTDHQFAGDAVAPAVGLGLFGAHVATPEDRRPPQQFTGVVVQGDRALHGDEGERWPVIVHAQRGPPAAGQVPALDRRGVGREDELPEGGVGPGGRTVEGEPDGGGVGPPVGPHGGQCAGAGGEPVEEGGDLPVGHGGHGGRLVPAPPAALRPDASGAGRACGGPTRRCARRGPWPRSACGAWSRRRDAAPRCRSRGSARRG